MLTIAFKSYIRGIKFLNMESVAYQKNEIEKASQSFFSGTLLSRILGLLRDILMAYTFGASAAIAALMVAFRLSNLFRRLFGEGALHAAFVPAYEKIRARSEVQAASFFTDLSFLLLGTLFLVTLLAEGTFYILLQKGHLSPGNFQILSLMTVLMPSLFFICHAAFCSSFLQCQGTYFLPAVSPVFFNLFWIAGVFFAKTFSPDQAVSHLAVFILIGLIFQWIALFPSTWHLLRTYLKGHSISFQGMKESFSILGKPFLLGIVGVSTTQLNNALDALFARMVHLKGPAYLWYALRIEQVPLAIFGVALAGALLPTFSRAYTQNRNSFLSLLDFSLAKSIGLLVPCSAALFFIGPAILNLLFARGEFGPDTALQTTYCLWAYGSGLAFQGIVLILAASFYTLGKYKITTQATFYSVILNVLLNTLFAFILKWGASGVALATSLSACFQMIFLLKELLKSLPDLELPKFKKSILKVSLISFLSGALMIFFAIHLNPFTLNKAFLAYPRGLSKQVFNFGFQTLFFLTALFSLSKVFRVKEVLALLNFIPKINK